MEKEKFKEFKPELLKVPTKNTLLYLHKLLHGPQKFVTDGMERELSATADATALTKWQMYAAKEHRRYDVFLWTEIIRLRMPKNGELFTFHSFRYHYYLIPINSGLPEILKGADKYDSALSRVSPWLSKVKAQFLMTIDDLDKSGTKLTLGTPKAPVAKEENQSAGQPEE